MKATIAQYNAEQLLTMREQVSKDIREAAGSGDQLISSQVEVLSRVQVGLCGLDLA